MKTFFATILILLTLGLFVQETNALTVSPAKLEISGNPGNVLSGTISLYNEQTRAQTFYVSFENFEPRDDTGTPTFVGNRSGLATWFSAPEEITLSSLERNELPFRIEIPTDAEPGGYFSAIFLGSQPPEALGGEVSIGGRIGILVLLRVNGEVPESGGILEFNSDKNFTTLRDLSFEYRFANTGGDRVVPRGNITITNTFGKTVDVISANPIEGSVLPGSARRFMSSWSIFSENTLMPLGFWDTVAYQWKYFHIGNYTATLELSWGFSGQNAQQSISFFMLPWQLLSLIIVSLGIILMIIKIGLQSYRRSIIRQLQNHEHQVKETNNNAEDTEEKSSKGDIQSKNTKMKL